MKVRFVLLSTFIVILVMSGVGLYFWSNSPSQYQMRQVKSIPSPYPAQSPNVDLSTHIRFSQRPEETFNFPIELGNVGPSKPLYAGSMQYPFYCMTIDSKLGQPLVDNHNGWGVPVYSDVSKMGQKEHIIGYSKDCSIKTQISYAAETQTGEVLLFDTLPTKAYPYVYQLEVGTINRFIYLIILPIEQQQNTNPKWNNKLIYQFLGGSGIGFRQGKLRIKRAIERRKEQLHDGYAVVTSTGNKTSYTYNMLLAEDTARRVKKQFTSQHGQPEYTVGIGGSGGGLAQYLIGQNSKGILDAAIPLYSYPDMVSQTLYALDCDLLNSYYAFRTSTPEYWQHWPNRVFVEGMNAQNGEQHLSAFLEPINQVLQAKWPSYPKGNSECINGWFGLSTFIHNPAQGFLREFFADDVVDNTHWNYWEDMATIYGRDKQGFANQTWGNVGVQYGLNALLENKLDINQFIDLNWHIGSWKPAEKMQPEKIYTHKLTKKSAIWLTLWSHHNITSSSQEFPAKRVSANTKAVEMAYRSGQVFIGHIDIPIIDVRHYLEPKLDMHHMSASFATRARMNNAQGHSDNQVIWVAHPDYSPVNKAFKYMDAWLSNIKNSPNLNISQVKPEALEDTCFDQQGEILFSGQSVWNGQWNKSNLSELSQTGNCLKHFPLFSNSRVAAGSPWQGSIFSCDLIPIEQAIANGIYQHINIKPFQSSLEKIFPTGVCNYQGKDQARPNNL